ncbi:hypothetical protein [Xanthomonas dyei]|uniref:hypothetical protein n=1 Tax=Xanthomonas dyei TaxID=743699 RepID=UPI001E381C59|nr:hypothetical protein [Xanthomonas dyei]MCC4632802.1 hypothetical protein [Xanthomonas dyei pv. eucalypti]
MNQLSEKSYIVCKTRVGFYPIFRKGVDFDEWKREMTKNQSPTGGNNFTFNAPVGSVQTGSKSVANVSQSISLTQLEELKTLLQRALSELGDSNLPDEIRSGAKGLIESTITEVEKPQPSKLSIRVLLGGLATMVQTLGSTSDASDALEKGFQALKGAISFFE